MPAGWLPAPAVDSRLVERESVGLPTSRIVDKSRRFARWAALQIIEVSSNWWSRRGSNARPPECDFEKGVEVTLEDLGRQWRWRATIGYKCKLAQRIRAGDTRRREGAPGAPRRPMGTPSVDGNVDGRLRRCRVGPNTRHSSDTCSVLRSLVNRRHRFQWLASDGRRAD